MRNRKVHVQLWLNEKEAAMLRKNVKAAGISQSAYFRHLIKGFVPKEHPPLDYFAFMRSLYSLANSLNQIAQKAHVLGVIDVQRYDKYAKMSADAVRTITDAMIVPREMTPEEREGFKHAETE